MATLQIWLAEALLVLGAAVAWAAAVPAPLYAQAEGDEGTPPPLTFNLTGPLVAGTSQTLTVSTDTQRSAQADSINYTYGKVHAARCTPRYGTELDNSGYSRAVDIENDLISPTTTANSPSISLRYDAQEPLVCYAVRLRYVNLDDDGDHDVIAGVALLWRIPRTIETESGETQGIGDNFLRHLTWSVPASAIVLLFTPVTVVVAWTYSGRPAVGAGLGAGFLVKSTIVLGANLWLLMLVLPLAGMFAMTVKIVR